MKIKLILLVFISLVAFPNLSGQKSTKKITITGQVTDLNNSPVSGVMIMIDGKTTSKKTNSKGFYKIKVKPSALQIGVFSIFTGALEEAINGRTVVDFKLGNMISPQLMEKTDVSDENVVDQGYGVTKKRDITKPVTQSDVDGNEYTSFSSIYDVLATLPGVLVRGTNVTIRGIGTTGSSTPLFVVNGTPVRSISGISPASVRSIEVLKGPSASVYGLEGANGVILIRLKGAD